MNRSILALAMFAKFLSLCPIADRLGTFTASLALSHYHRDFVTTDEQIVDTSYLPQALKLLDTFERLIVWQDKYKLSKSASFEVLRATYLSEIATSSEPNRAS